MSIRRPARAKPNHDRGKPLTKHPDRRSLPSRGRRKAARHSDFDKKQFAVGAGAGSHEETRRTEAQARLKSLEHNNGFWKSSSCPSQWGRPRGI